MPISDRQYLNDFADWSGGASTIEGLSSSDSPSCFSRANLLLRAQDFLQVRFFALWRHVLPITWFGFKASPVIHFYGGA